MRRENVCIRHPGEGRGPVGDCSPILDTGLRRYDGVFKLHIVLKQFRLMAGCTEIEDWPSPPGQCVADARYPVSHALGYCRPGRIERLPRLLVRISDFEMTKLAQAEDLATYQWKLAFEFGLVRLLHDQNQVGLLAHQCGNMPSTMGTEIQSVCLRHFERQRVGRLPDQGAKTGRRNGLPGQFLLQQGLRKRAAANVTDT